MVKPNKQVYIEATNPLKDGDTEFISKEDLENPEKYEKLIDEKGNVFAMPRGEQDRLERASNNARGCFLSFVFGFIILLFGTGAALVKKEYKANKKHPNVISYINTKDETIIITDVYNKQERMINYTGLKGKMPSYAQHKFPEQVKYSRVGDTVMFATPYYAEHRIFFLARKYKQRNVLFLNQDSIITRMQSEKTR